MENNEKRGKLSASFIMGAVALAFLAIGYQTALFVHRATQLHILAAKEAPDTVYVVERWVDTADAASPESGATGHHNGIVRYEQRRNASHSRPVQRSPRSSRFPTQGPLLLSGRLNQSHTDHRVSRH